MSKQLKKLYKDFIREKVNHKYIYDNKNCLILGENFVENYYIILMQDWNNSLSKKLPDYYLLIENCKKPEFLKFKQVDKRNAYVRIEKKILEQHEKLFSLLIKQGLFYNPETAKNSTNTQILVHRLNLCLYINIIKLECHHNDKDKKNNVILNLTPIEKEKHKLLDDAPEKLYQELTDKYHKEFVRKIFHPKRNTLASRYNVVIDVLFDLKNGKSVLEIERIHFGRLKETTIRKIKNFYFYTEEFLHYLYCLATRSFSAFVEDFENQWFYALKFDIFNNSEIQARYEIFRYILDFVTMKSQKT